MAEGPRRYSFHPLEKRGLLLGLDVAQILTLIAGLAAALAVGDAIPGAAGVAVAACLLGAAAGGALWPKADRPLVTWVPSAASWLARRAHGPAISGEPHGGCALKPAGLDLIELPAEPGQLPLGVIRDRRSGTWSAVMPVGGRSFSLLDPEQQIQRLDAWRTVLAALARPDSPIKRVQWVERSAPYVGDGLHIPTPCKQSGAAHASYADLIANVAPRTQTHEVWVVLSVDCSRHRVGNSRRPGEGLRRELRLLEGQLCHADLRPGPSLGVSRLHSVLADLHGTRGPGHLIGGAASPWPLASDETWSALRTDDSWHATYWIAEWPRVEVTPDFLTPLLLGGGRRTVSVTMAAVPADRAMREVRSARTADLADSELRHRAGFLPSARRAKEADGVARRESELAEGHAEFRFSGYVTVSAPDREALDAASAAAEHAAQETHVELRRLFGRQAEAFAWTLPLGRGLA